MPNNKRKVSTTESDRTIQEDVRKLVLERIKVSSKNLRVAVGSDDFKSTEDMLKSVEQGDEAGQRIIDAHMEFLKAMASGEIYSDD